MPPFLKFVIRRLLIIPITLLIVTALLYAAVMVTPPEERALLYLTHLSPHITEEQLQKLIARTIVDRGLDQPYPIQYLNWLGTLISGQWGWSPNLRTNVLDYLITHTPVTVEITLYSLLTFIPLGILSGVLAGRAHGQTADNSFRFLAFSATSIPPFILGLMMISFLYVGLKWFAPGRLSDPIALIVKSSSFQAYTGLVTIDGLLNGRLDVTLDALKHLVMPVLTVSALHWATLGRVTRAAITDELDKDYIVAARAHGLSQRRIVWRHAFRNTLVPALTSSVLAAASLLGGVYIVEIVFNMHGVSELITEAVQQQTADAPAALGFTVYNILAVLLLMFVLDVLQAVIDPRMREKVQV
ncbi:MAG TPA: ABC transporter permease [Anaerolineae bacterium]|nr:ABC transporter permease [Anaerolineae bacterium]